jgi:hypothetical protein
MALGQGSRTGGWVCFYTTAGDPKFGFVAQRSKTGHWVRIFKPAQWHAVGFVFTKPPANVRLASLRNAANEPLGSYFQNIWGIRS